MTLATSALELATWLGRVNADGTLITDLATEIKGEIGEAIRFYNRRPYALTEFRGFQVSTTNGTTWYSTVDLTSGDGDQDNTSRTAVDVNTLMRIAYMRDDNGDGLDFDLKRLSYSEFEALFEGATPNNSPTYYTVYAGQIGLWPTPDGVYTIYGSGHIKAPVPTEDDDTSVWLDECEEMILAAAGKRVALKYLRDTERAAEFASIESLAEAQLQKEHVAKSATGRLRSHG